MLALIGHMSRAMLERYYHIRMAAKRDAVGRNSLMRRGSHRWTRNAASTRLPRSGYLCSDGRAASGAIGGRCGCTKLL